MERLSTDYRTLIPTTTTPFDAWVLSEWMVVGPRAEELQSRRWRSVLSGRVPHHHLCLGRALMIILYQSLRQDSQLVQPHLRAVPCHLLVWGRMRWDCWLRELQAFYLFSSNSFRSRFFSSSTSFSSTSSRSSSRCSNSSSSIISLSRVLFLSLPQIFQSCPIFLHWYSFCLT